MNNTITTQTPVVLYVEDDPHSRRVMNLMLKAVLKFDNVTIFENSANFQERVEALDVMLDIIFLDIHMQPIDGFEMLSILRQSPKFANTRIVALTASVMSEEVNRLQTAGFDGCIAKPINQEQFPHLLNAILSGEAIWRIA